MESTLEFYATPKHQKDIHWWVSRLADLGIGVEDYDPAFQIAQFHHKGQTRKNGGPFLIHPVRVAARVAGRAWKQGERYEQVKHLIRVALLHDVLEDALEPFKAAQSIALTVSASEYWAVEALTKRAGESERDYVLRIREHRTFAIPVKVEDRWDNLNDMVGAWSPERRRKYALLSAIHYLPMAYEYDHELASNMEVLIMKEIV